MPRSTVRAFPSIARARARRRARASRALSHARALTGLFPCLLLGAIAPACERATERTSERTTEPALAAAEPLPTEAERADLAALIEAYTPLNPTATSDRLDAWLADQRALLRELCGRAGPGLGRLALEAFEAEPPHPDGVRVALLELAAHGLGGELAPRLEQFITTYDAGVGLFVRTEAVRILAETSPERALEFLEPLVREDRPTTTRPPQAALLDGWLAAARALGRQDPGVLADVATNIFQPPEARYAAIAGLGELGGPLAGAALEEILIEASSDGYVRRKAAQALVRCVPPEEFCPLLATVAGHESDAVFLNFLGDMIDRHCAGVALEESAPAADERH
jgi:hypothetical protein